VSSDDRELGELEEHPVEEPVDRWRQDVRGGE
jgi:hypothetical protein